MKYKATLNTTRTDADPHKLVSYGSTLELSENWAKSAIRGEPRGAYVTITDNVDVPRKIFTKGEKDEVIVQKVEHIRVTTGDGTVVVSEDPAGIEEHGDAGVAGKIAGEK